MRTLHTEIEIAGTPQVVWDVLVDFPSYPDWNPFIRSIAGPLEAGGRLEVKLVPPGGRGVTIRPRILAVEPDRQLRWRGRLLVPGLFDGEHAFRIERIDEGRVRFVHAETFDGLLVPLLRGVLRRTERGFVAMNEALARRVRATLPPTAPA